MLEPYRSILNSLSEGICSLNLDLQIECFNRYTERLTGIKLQQAQSKYLSEIFPYLGEDLTALVHKVIASGSPVKGISKRLQHRNGEFIPVTISASPIRDANGILTGVVLTFQDNRALEVLRRELRRRHTFGDIVSKDREVLRILDILPDIAESESTVLILGPTGTGKELFARAIHTASPRCKGPFVAVNCGALPDTLLESELFGFKKGAFTDAKRDKPGRFALAKRGTLFLDEVGDLSPAMQVKLMRVLQEKQYEPLGATASEKADVRIVAATNRDLHALMEQGDFRADLYYRLNVIEFYLPPLVERPADIPLLVEHFIENLNAEKGRNITRVAPSAMSMLMRYQYPGNIRELRNIIERAYILCRFDEIREECLPPHIALTPEKERTETMPNNSNRFPDSSTDAQREIILTTLEKTEGRKGAAAAMLGINRSTLWRKMRQLQINAKET